MHQRIISLAPSNTEILYALGADDRLVAVTRYCDFPEEANKKPRIGGWLDINDELVKSYNPDLILTSTFVKNKFDEIENIAKNYNNQNTINNENNSNNKKLKNKNYKPRVYIEEWHKPP